MSVRTTLYAPRLQQPVPNGRVVVEGREARHARAARLRPGAEVHLTDGAGELWRARVDSLEAGRVCCVLVRKVSAPADLDLELAFGVGAKARTLWLVEKAVELGVSGLQPIEFERSASVADAARSPAFWAKARRRAMVSLTQCGGARLPQLRSPTALEAYLAILEPAAGDLSVVLDGDGDASLLQLLSDHQPGGGRTRFLIGPEGGMGPREREACRATGLRFASLGGRVLRFETAALVAATAAGLVRSAGGALPRGAPAGKVAATAGVAGGASR